MLVVFADYNTMFCCGCWRDRVECVLSGGNDAFRHCERTATAIPRMLAPRFAQNFLQLFFENHTQIQCFDVKTTINK